MKPNPTRSALILIDMENGFVDHRGGHCIQGAQATIPACAYACDLARSKGIPVFFVKRIYRSDGSDVELTRYAAWTCGPCFWRGPPPPTASAPPATTPSPWSTTPWC